MTGRRLKDDNSQGCINIIKKMDPGFAAANPFPLVWGKVGME